MPRRPTAVAVQDWATELGTVGGRLGPHFSRAEPRRRAVAYLRGLLCAGRRKNAWRLAEHLGDPTPDGVRHLLGRADWDADAVRDDLTRHAHGHLADDDGVLVVDETGFLKKGATSAGVRRRYSGTAGRVENCQVGVFLALAGRHGRALLDRELYLPREWAADAGRRKRAGIPTSVTFAAKPRSAERMPRRARRLGVKAAWVAAGTVYGNDGKFRRFLEVSRQPCVLAVQSNQQLWDGTGRSRVDAVAASRPAGAWRRAGAGAGAKGPRWYDWAARPFGPVDGRGWQLWPLVRRHRERSDERAYYLCRGPAATPWRELVRVAGSRWAVEIYQADCTSRRGWVGTRRVGYHRRGGVARAGRVVPATPGRPHRRSRMPDTTRRPAPPRA